MPYRDLYYLDATLFGSQLQSDAIIDVVAALLTVERSHLTLVRMQINVLLALTC